MGDGSEPITDDELLYRRVPQVYYPGGDLSPKAFKATDLDESGLSLVRAGYSTPERAAITGRNKPMYIAVLRAGDLHEHGLTIVPRPLPGNPGHCEIPELQYVDRQDSFSRGAQVLLATRLCIEVLGPYPGQPGPPTREVDIIGR